MGVMQVDTPFHAGTFNEQDLDLLTALANYAAVAVERLKNAKIAEFEREVRSRLERYHSPAVIESIVRFELFDDGDATRFVLRHSLPIIMANEPTDTLAGCWWGRGPAPRRIDGASRLSDPQGACSMRCWPLRGSPASRVPSSPIR